VNPTPPRTFFAPLYRHVSQFSHFTDRFMLYVVARTTASFRALMLSL
jgi:hypothetical protein